MIAQDLADPPEGFYTLEEEAERMRLRQDRHDAAREERDLLLGVRARAPEDYRFEGNLGEIEEMTEGMTPREREGFNLLQRDEFERWGEIQERGFAAVRAQFELQEAVSKRLRQEWKDHDGKGAQ